MRIECYRQQLFHLAEKLAVGVKWLPYTRRFTIWKHSRLNVQKRKIDTTRHIDYLYVEVEKEAEKMLHKLGIQEETLKKIVLKKYTFHLRGENYTRFDEKLKNSYLQLHERLAYRSGEQGRALVVTAQLEQPKRGDRLDGADGDARPRLGEVVCGLQRVWVQDQAKVEGQHGDDVEPHEEVLVRLVERHEARDAQHRQKPKRGQTRAGHIQRVVPIRRQTKLDES